MTMKHTSNYQDFLKVFALLAMFLDHLGLYFFPEYEAMRVIGRIAMPLFCFFAGYNFHKKPKIKILVVGVIYYAFTIILFGQYMIPNILISIYLGQLYIYAFHKSLKRFFYKGYCHVVFLGIFSSITIHLFEYGTLAIAIMVLGYIAKRDPAYTKLAMLLSIILSVIHTLVIFDFSLVNIYILVILSGFEYALIIAKNFEERITINLRVISKYSLYIYAVHVSVIQLIYVYMYINFPL